MPEAPIRNLQSLLAQMLSDQTVENAQAAVVGFFTSNISLLKAGGLLLTLLFVGAAIYVGIATGWFALYGDRIQDVALRKDMPKKRSLKAWRSIQRHYFAGSDNDLKVALVEADNLLDEALRVGGVRGENLGDRLKSLTEAQLPNIDRIWEAHKLRNRLVHETDFRLTRDTAERALAVYRDAFRELGLLDE
jgi:hypothetical protein